MSRDAINCRAAELLRSAFHGQGIVHEHGWNASPDGVKEGAILAKKAALDGFLDLGSRAVAQLAFADAGVHQAQNGVIRRMKGLESLRTAEEFQEFGVHGDQV
jgi:hypothetical protein